jgi:Na+-driven multidrug efflux pump
VGNDEFSLGLFGVDDGGDWGCMWMRVAYQLGKGPHGMTKRVGYKAILVAFIMAVLGSTTLLSLKNTLPSLLMKDTIIQHMLLNLFSLLALSNVSVTMGTVAWTSVGGQG